EVLAAPNPDRRSDPRFGPQFGVAVDCRLASSGPNVALALLDLSAGGCQLHVAGRVELGRAVVLAFRPPGGRAAVRVAGAVGWVQPFRGVANRGGGAFDRRLGGDELASLADFEPGPIPRPLTETEDVPFDAIPGEVDEDTLY